MTIDKPPAGTEIAYLKRISPTLPNGPTLNSLGRPDSWAETSTVTEDWGRLKVTFGSTEVTFLRGVPCEVLSWSFAEPFGAQAAEIRFPQIHPRSILGTGDLAPFTDACDVTISRVYFDTGTNQEVEVEFWHGLWVSEDISHDEATASTTFQCVGVLYEADQRLSKPTTAPISLRSALTVVADLLSGTTSGEDFRFNPPTGWNLSYPIQVTDTASYQSILSHVQEILAVCYDAGIQSTVTNSARTAVIAEKDTTTVHHQIAVGTPGLSLDVTRDLTMQPNVIYASGQSPYDNCDWRNAKYPGIASGNVFWGRLFGSYIAPVAYKPAVEPYLSAADGAVAGANPAYNPAVLRVERYEQFGAVNKLEAEGSASQELARESGPGWAGRLTLHGVDPKLTCRWAMREGQNIQVIGLRGENPIFHIAKVDARPGGATVELTVDTLARDLPTLGAVLERRRDNTDLVRKDRPARNISRLVDDRMAPWDCESGAGVVPATSVPALGWAVVKVPSATRGRIVRVNLTATVACEFAVGIFDRAILPAELAAAGTPADSDYWDFLAWPDTSGLAQAIGAGDDLCGYGAMSAADDLAVLSGTLRSDAGFPYASQAPPWLWVALWATSACSISGRLYPGPAGAS